MEKMRVGDQITFIYCDDLGETSRFYEGLLELPLVLDQGSCRIVRVADKGGGYLGYCQRPGTDKGREGVIITLVVEEREGVELWYRILSERGVEIPDPPKENPDYGIYHFFFLDPDGYTLEVQFFMDPAWKSLE